ncbi:MAG: DUF481 domain-containing protein [Verrucomicrobiota bacterium]
MNWNRSLSMAAGLAVTLAGSAAHADEAAAAVTSTNAVVPTPPPAKWSTSLNVGVTITSGNSDSLLGTIDFLTDRKTDKNELKIGGAGGYGETRNTSQGTTTVTINANFVGGFVQDNVSFTERLYGYARVDARHDEVADIAYRVPIGVGAGYYVVKTKPSELSFELGPGYLWQKVGGVASDFATLRIAELFRRELTDRSRLRENVEWLPQIDKFSNYILNASITLEADLTKDKNSNMSLTLLDTYNSEPASGKERNDLKLIAAVGCKF